MDLKTYQTLKAKRRQLEAKFDKNPSDEIRSQLDDIATQLEKDRPNIETVYGSIAQPANLKAE